MISFTLGVIRTLAIAMLGILIGSLIEFDGKTMNERISQWTRSSGLRKTINENLGRASIASTELLHDARLGIEKRKGLLTAGQSAPQRSRDPEAETDSSERAEIRDILRSSD